MGDTERLAELIEQKRQVLAQLWRLTERQADMVAQGELPRLLRLLAAKQTLLDQLQGLEQQLEPYRGQQPEQRRWASETLRSQARQSAEACEQYLEQIMQVERQCESQLARRRDDAARRLQGAANAAQARTEYLQTDAGEPRQLDLSSET